MVKAKARVSCTIFLPDRESERLNTTNFPFRGDGKDCDESRWFKGSWPCSQNCWPQITKASFCRQLITVMNCGQHASSNERTNFSVYPGSYIEEPQDRGTAASILLAVTHVITEEPTAEIAIYYTDLIDRSDEGIANYVSYACQLIANQYYDRFILLGACPDSARTDCGWIVPDQRLSSCSHCSLEVHRVKRLYDNPRRSQACGLFRCNAFLNTKVVIVRVDTLWNLAWCFLPNTMQRFEELRQVLLAEKSGRIPNGLFSEALLRVYRNLEYLGFFRHVIKPLYKLALVVPVKGINW